MEVQFPCLDDIRQIDPSAFIAEQTYVRGAVVIGAKSSIWPMSVVRGDKGWIRIGARCNLQDGVICHADPDAFLTIGDGVSIGHGAIVHGCTIEDDVLIGMGAVVLNWAHIGHGSLIAARALVPERMIVPPNSLVVGIPGKIQPLRPELHERILRTADNYVELSRHYLEH